MQRIKDIMFDNPFVNQLRFDNYEHSDNEDDANKNNILSHDFLQKIDDTMFDNTSIDQ